MEKFTEVSGSQLTDRMLGLVVHASNKAEYQSYKLVLVIIPGDLRREIEAELLDRKINFINLSKELARKIVSQSKRDRVKRLETEVSEIACQCNASVWMSKLDLLFEPSLKNDPMMLLKMVSKFKTVVAIWPGEITETSVVYSKPGKPDYKTYPLKELNDIQVIDACNGVMK